MPPMKFQFLETMASKTGMVCGGVSVGSEEMVIAADVLQHHTTCMYMYTTWQTTLLKHMYISKMHTSSQHAICIQFVENTPHTYIYVHCTYTLINSMAYAGRFAAASRP